MSGIRKIQKTRKMQSTQKTQTRKTQETQKTQRIQMLAAAGAMAGCIAGFSLNTEKLKAAEEHSAVFITASDLHYLAPELTDHGEFFEQVTANGDGKVMDYSEELVEAFTEQIIGEHPDALILTGDLSFNGEKRSLECLAEKLSGVEAAGIPAFVIPGNHDIDSTMAVRYEGDGYEKTENVTAEEFAEIFSEFGYKDALSRDPASCSYFAELSENVLLLAIDVNGTASPGFLADETADWAERQLEYAQKEGKRVIAVSHQNLLPHNDLFVDGYQIAKADRLLQMYETYEVICNLSGHMHIQHAAESEDGLTEILTSALSIAPNQYGRLTVTVTDPGPEQESDRSREDAGTSASEPKSPDSQELTEEKTTAAEVQYSTQSVDVSAWAEEHQSEDAALLAFEEYADAYFRQNTRRQILKQVEEADRTEEMTQYLIDVNSRYFSGRQDLISWEDPSYEAWRGNGTLWGVYLLSIEKGENRDFTTINFTVQ